MRKFIKYQNEFILGVIAIILLIVLIWISIWELGFLAVNIGKVIDSGNGKGTGMNFDLNGAKQLNLKGLAQ